MPANSALIAVLLVERPMCLECISAKAEVSAAEVRRYLIDIATSLDLRHHANDRCRICGNIGPVYSVRRSAS
jgi:hypothetical protein